MTGERQREQPMPGWVPPQGPPPGNAYAWPPYPSPGYGPPPGFVPSRRRRSRWLTVGLPVGLVLLLGGGGAAITLFVTSVGTSIKPAEQAANAYAKALVEQRWSDAQAMLCSQDRVVTPDQLAAHYSRPQLTGYSVEGVNVMNYNGQVSATATIRFDTADGLYNSTTVPLTKENAAWRPCP
jgi:hypothetical protein